MRIYLKNEAVSTCLLLNLYFSDERLNILQYLLTVSISFLSNLYQPFWHQDQFCGRCGVGGVGGWGEETGGGAQESFEPGWVPNRLVPWPGALGTPLLTAHFLLYCLSIHLVLFN